MATIKINSILGGIATANRFALGGQYDQSIGIDPQIQVFPSSNSVGGAISPISGQDRSGAAVDGAPLWFTTNPKNSLVYTYLSSGGFVSYSSILGSETDIGTPTSGAGNGMAYYNNYIYLFTPTDVSRYGPLNNSPSLTNTVWSGATLGSQTNLTDTSYPTVRRVTMPNHAAHVHGDNKLYFCDFINGQGIIHAIKTSKSSDEGDTNNGSTYNVLDLPFGYYPTALESFGDTLVIAAAQGADNVVRNRNSAIFLWDTFSSSFFRRIDIPDGLVTALKNKNGLVYIFSGDNDDRHRVSVYSGGSAAQQLREMPGSSPLAGAVDVYGERISWGSAIDWPKRAATVYSLGYTGGDLPKTALNTTFRVSTTGIRPQSTAFLYYRKSQLKLEPIIGWRDDSNNGIDSIGGSSNTHFRSEIFTLGQKFKINKIRFSLFEELDANQTITPRIILDAGTVGTLDYDAQSGDFTEGLTITGGTTGCTATIKSDSDSGTTGTLTLTNIKRGSGESDYFKDNEAITDSSTGAATVNGNIYGDGSAGTLSLKFGEPLSTVNSTNFPNKQNIVLFPELTGQHSFQLEFEFSGSRQPTVLLPVTIEYELLAD